MHLFKMVKGVDLPDFERMTYKEAITNYGSDKPDLRFDMRFNDLTELMQNKGFKVFDEAEVVLGIRVEGASNFTRKQLDKLTDFVRSQQVGAKGFQWSGFHRWSILVTALEELCERNNGLVLHRVDIHHAPENEVAHKPIRDHILEASD